MFAPGRQLRRGSGLGGPVNPQVTVLLVSTTWGNLRKPEMLHLSQRMLKVLLKNYQAKCVSIHLILKNSCQIWNFWEALEKSINTSPTPSSQRLWYCNSGTAGTCWLIKRPAPGGTRVPSAREVAGLTFHLCFLLGGYRLGRCGKCGKWVHLQKGQWVILLEPHLGK